ncbi:D-tagatose-bisphosphate aldolase, class II, non-catalytic subunit [Rhizobium sp. 16-449-1b]|uniref:D-tagatose-bisphosphate aldolase, class II, non-catalytic subunit n=1 Tax=Rhizobium sp. 16-449-1b TaxID=2819989 RepID=UPI001ADC14AD|nr:D-tagatose-bisphosphate aldolase, class II, non-catalytic subunit [Rhizobium sp. 16-449-1b]MBO9195151.1 D-tagatose-bisphosphate aldolase, class II, non-catalytic subunit [Rhizobium sp. 16-449-1b]
MSDALDQNRESALSKLFGARQQPLPRGITSVCSAHPLVIEAALRRAAREGTVVLIEATCNQVNQEGGYTGMTPAAFRQFIERIAIEVGFPLERIILGGDHLGPNPWKKLGADEAMVRAEAMVAAYVEAGFEKLHLDTSMGCAGEPAALDDEVTAERAARLTRVAEDTARRIGQRPPVYIIGTEVPPPGGATHAIEELEVTSPDAALKTLAIHTSAFEKAGAGAAMDRVIGIVVQPGVEFGNANVVLYKPDRAQGLASSLSRMPRLLFEAHSTDYQTVAELSALVDGGFAILKVGPGLTFALREALYGLDAIRQVLAGGSDSLHAEMDAIMLSQPQHWAGHYTGSAKEMRLQRHFSYSDRIRYYWPDRQAAGAVEALMAALPDPIPETLISQYLARVYPDVVTGRVAPRARDLCLAAIDAALAPYSTATASQ